MSDAFYTIVRALGRHAFWMSGSPIVIGLENVPAIGPCIIAATHQSPFDVPLLIRHTPRHLDFVSIVEVFRNPLLAWFYGSLNAFPLDRSRPDSKTVRIIMDRLARSRAVAMFPEGRVREGAESVVHSRRIRPGIGRLATLTGAPIVPCVIVGSARYRRAAAWLPLRRTRYGIIYGPPIDRALDPDQIESRLIDDYGTLHTRLLHSMDPAL